jgi:hypothetical protein
MFSVPHFLSSPKNDHLRLQRTDEDIEPIKTQIANLLQDIMEIITQDIMKNGQGITFFANSLFMKMPKAPQVRSMMSFR